MLDIDCHSDDVPLFKINEAIDNFLFRLERDLIRLDEFPLPSIIVRTGRGIQLLITIEQCSKALLFLYKATAHGLFNRISNLISEYEEELGLLTLDRSASGRGAGLYRLPGSYNCKS